jgi:hypothetical protein
VQFETAGGGGLPLRCGMATDNRLEEEQARLDAMMAEFRAARQRRLEKQAIAEVNRRLTQRTPAVDPKVPPAKLN